MRIVPSVKSSERFTANVPLLRIELDERLPLVPPLPSCRVPALIVVLPLKGLVALKMRVAAPPLMICPLPLIELLKLPSTV